MWGNEGEDLFIQEDEANSNPMFSPSYVRNTVDDMDLKEFDRKAEVEDVEVQPVEHGLADEQHVSIKLIMIMIVSDCSDKKSMPRDTNNLLLQAVVGSYFAVLVHLVGSGFLAHSIVSVVGGSDKTVWITSVLTFQQLILGPPIAQAADLWGRKRFVVGTGLLGTIGCIIVSRSDSIGQVIAGQTIVGLATVSQPLIHAIASEILPRKYRPWAQATIQIETGLASLVALYGGAAMCNRDPEGFRNFWYMTAAIYFVSIVIIFLCYNPPKRELQYMTFREKIHKLDLVGAGLLMITILGICIALAWSHNPYEWSNAHILVPFIVGIVGALCVGVYATKFKKDGIIHHDLFKRSRNYWICLLCLLAEGFAFFAQINYFGYAIGTLYSKDLMQVANVYSICWYSFIVFNVAAGYYCSRVMSVRRVLTLSFGCYVIFFILMATSNLNTGNSIWCYGIFSGLGLGVSITALIVAVQLSTPPELIAPATALAIAARASGGSMGVAVYNAIFNGALSDNLAAKISSAAMSHGLPPSSIGQLIMALSTQDRVALVNIPGITPEIIQASTIALKEAFNIGFRNVFIAAACFTFVAMCRKYPRYPHAKYLTDRSNSFTVSQRHAERIHSSYRCATIRGYEGL